MLLVMKGILLQWIDGAIEKGQHVSRNEEDQIVIDWKDHIAWD